MLGLPALGIALFGAGILVSQHGLRASHLDHRVHTVMPMVARIHHQGNPTISPTLHQQAPTLPMRHQRLAASEVSTTKPTLEIAVWARVRDSIHPQDVSEFLKTFPHTRFAFAARMRLRQFLREPQREGELLVDLSPRR